jgi:hypothetical protein
MKQTAIFSLFLSFALPLFAQKEPQYAKSPSIFQYWINKYKAEREAYRTSVLEYYSVREFGLSTATRQDKQISTVPLSGIGFQINTGRIREQEKIIKERMFRVQLDALLGNTSNNPPLFGNAIFSFDWGYLHKISPEWAVGFEQTNSINSNATSVLQNSSFTLEGLIDIGVKARWRKQFDIFKKTQDIEWHIALPIVGEMYRFPDFNGLSGLGDRVETVYLGKMLKIRSEIFLNAKYGWGQENTNRRRFGYAWDFRYLNGGDNYRVVSGIHTLKFQYLLNKK